MAASTGTELYVWRRDVTPSKRGWVNWIIAGAVALCGFGAFAAYMADDPGSISTFVGLGVFLCLLVWLIPRVYDWGRRRHPDIRMEGREMVWAKVRVPIDQVDRWNVARNRVSTYNGTTSSTMTIGVVSFQMIGGGEKPKTFSFPHLSEAEEEDVAAAIERVLPGRRISS